MLKSGLELRTGFSHEFIPVAAAFENPGFDAAGPVLYLAWRYHAKRGSAMLQEFFRQHPTQGGHRNLTGLRLDDLENGVFRLADSIFRIFQALCADNPANRSGATPGALRPC